MWLFMLVVVVGFNGWLVLGCGATEWSPFVDDFANNAYKIRLLFCFRLVRRGKFIIFNHSDSMKKA